MTKKSSTQVGLQIQHIFTICHSKGNLTKWFYEVNLSGLDSYGMTKFVVIFDEFEVYTELVEVSL